VGATLPEAMTTNAMRSLDNAIVRILPQALSAINAFLERATWMLEIHSVAQNVKNFNSI